VAKSGPGLGGGVAAPIEMNIEHRTSNAQHRMKNKPPLPNSGSPPLFFIQYPVSFFVFIQYQLFNLQPATI